MLNKVTLIGRVGCDVETRYTPNQTEIANFRVATTRSWTDQQNNRQEKTEWHNIVMWARTAERAKEMVKKGDLIYIEGSVEYQQWEKDGQKRYRTDIRAHQFLMLSPKGQRGDGPKVPDSDYNFDGNDEDVPF